MDEEKNIDDVSVPDLKHKARLEIQLCVHQLGLHIRKASIAKLSTGSVQEKQELIIFELKIEALRKIMRKAAEECAPEKKVTEEPVPKKKTILRVVK